MAELPEAVLIERALSGSVVGKRSVACKISSEYALRHAATTFEKRLTGQPLHGVRRHGDELFFHFGPDTVLVVKPGPTGRVQHLPNAADSATDPIIRIAFDDGSLLAIDFARPLGHADLAGSMDEYLKATEAGPDALSDDLTLDAFQERLRTATGPIKSVLSDWRVVAGIGPFWSDEILYQARIHPSFDAAALVDLDRKAIYDAMRDTLQAAIDAGGDVKKLPDWMLTAMRRSDTRVNPESGATFTKVMVDGVVSYYDPELQKA